MTITADDLIPEVDKAARSAARSWTGALNSEDIANDMWVELFESPSSLGKLLESEKPDRDRILRFIARRVAQKATADYEVFSGNSNYSTDDVRRILAAGGAGDVPGTPSHTEWLDVQAGLGTISPWYAEVIFSHYVVGDYEEPPGDKGSTLTRARDALTVAMNANNRTARAEYDGPGSRRVLSNAAASSLSKREGGDQ